MSRASKPAGQCGYCDPPRRCGRARARHRHSMAKRRRPAPEPGGHSNAVVGMSAASSEIPLACAFRWWPATRKLPWANHHLGRGPDHVTYTCSRVSPRGETIQVDRRSRPDTYKSRAAVAVMPCTKPGYLPTSVCAFIPDRYRRRHFIVNAVLTLLNSPNPAHRTPAHRSRAPCRLRPKRCVTRGTVTASCSACLSAAIIASRIKQRWRV